MVSCNKNQADVDRIQKEYRETYGKNEIYIKTNDALLTSIESLKKDENYLKMISQGKQPIYVLKLKVYQSIFTVLLANILRIQ